MKELVGKCSNNVTPREVDQIFKSLHKSKKYNYDLAQVLWLSDRY